MAAGRSFKRPIIRAAILFGAAFPPRASGARAAEFTFGFGAPGRAGGSPGELRTFEVFCTLASAVEGSSAGWLAGAFEDRIE